MTHRATKSSPIRCKKRTGGLKRANTCPNEDIRQSKNLRNQELHELPSNKAVRIQEEIQVETFPLRPIKNWRWMYTGQREGWGEPKGNFGNFRVRSWDHHSRTTQYRERKTRSVAGIYDEVQGLYAVAKVCVTDFTLFSNPFLNALDVTILV